MINPDDCQDQKAAKFGGWESIACVLPNKESGLRGVRNDVSGILNISTTPQEMSALAVFDYGNFIITKKWGKGGTVCVCEASCG